MASLTTAIDRAQTLGYIWTNEVAGYAIKYAVRVPSPDGGERIILGTNRRIGEHALAWQPVGGTPTDYSFTLLEIRLNPKGSGEGKASLTSRIVADNEAKMLRLDDYAAAPALIENVRRQ
jgi:hypothetical protein